jgi:hypothetical protein
VNQDAIIDYGKVKGEKKESHGLEMQADFVIDEEFKE